MSTTVVAAAAMSQSPLGHHVIVVCDDGSAWGLGSDGGWKSVNPVPGTLAHHRQDPPAYAALQKERQAQNLAVQAYADRQADR